MEHMFDWLYKQANLQSMCSITSQAMQPEYQPCFAMRGMQKLPALCHRRSALMVKRNDCARSPFPPAALRNQLPPQCTPGCQLISHLGDGTGELTEFRCLDQKSRQCSRSTGRRSSSACWGRTARSGLAHSEEKEAGGQLSREQRRGCFPIAETSVRINFFMSSPPLGCQVVLRHPPPGHVYQNHDVNQQFLFQSIASLYDTAQFCLHKLRCTLFVLQKRTPLEKVAGTQCFNIFMIGGGRLPQSQALFLGIALLGWDTGPN